jgi:hypothetical protein
MSAPDNDLFTDLFPSTERALISVGMTGSRTIIACDGELITAGVNRTSDEFEKVFGDSFDTPDVPGISVVTVKFLDFNEKIADAEWSGMTWQLVDIKPATSDDIEKLLASRPPGSEKRDRERTMVSDGIICDPQNLEDHDSEQALVTCGMARTCTVIAADGKMIHLAVELASDLFEHVFVGGVGEPDTPGIYLLTVQPTGYQELTHQCLRIFWEEEDSKPATSDEIARLLAASADYMKRHPPIR